MFDLPILIIKHPASDINFYNDILTRFTNKQSCQGGANALQQLDAKQVHLVVIESDLGDMSGLEVAEVIRTIETASDHFTYIILIDTLSSHHSDESFAEIVDALLPRDRKHNLGQAVMVGCRLSGQINSIQQTNKRLSKSNLELQKGQLLDPTTGLGNQRFAQQSIKDVIRQIESRGGAACVVLLSIENFRPLLDKYDERIKDEYIVAVTDKLLRLVRPMDIVTYYQAGVFALILLQSDIKDCSAESYQRIFNGLNERSVATAAGYLDINLAMSICASNADFGAPDPEKLLDTAFKNLDKARHSNSIAVEHLSPAA